MEARELRIGNNLNYDTAEGDILPTVIDWQDIKWATEDLKGFNLVHSPIPITEEWLLRFGFDNIGVKELPNKSHLQITNNFIGSVIFNPLKTDFIELTEHVQYIHQLQNLYFALTGEELTPRS